ncbi:MAG: NADH-quinone oxidoreductase subunit J [Verrucomicrobiae bacterium]|nr:NADH-quinone oxidoreductase subunit J [Verrucomicrobiae bacterium]MDW8310240.1 NADH-quinone oxidoreductase subunit J [Verrucomicrobiales bacterium]
MTLSFLIIAVLTLAGAIAAVTLRNLVHCALALVVAFAGLAAAFLQLDAQFVGFAQVLIYIGAVAILIVFAVLLTRGGEPPQQQTFSLSWPWGLAVAAVVFATLAWAISGSFAARREPAAQVEATTKQIGDALMTRFVLPLEVAGLLLTVALIGAVLIAMRERLPESRTDNEGLRTDQPSAPSGVLDRAPSGGQP